MNLHLTTKVLERPKFQPNSRIIVEISSTYETILYALVDILIYEQFNQKELLET